jgi:hypothetical protein
MEALSEIFAYMAGAPTMAGLILTAVIIFLTSDWRLSLTALLVQYVLIGMALTNTIRLEVVIIKILIGVLTVAILYLTARRIQERKGALETEQGRARFLGMQVRWEAGPLGLPLRLMTVLLVVLAIIRVFDNYTLPLLPADIAFAATWLGAMGVAGLVLSGDPLRVAASLLTILGGFDLVYAGLEPSLAIVGFWGTLILLAALAFAYLATTQDLGLDTAQPSRPPPATNLVAPSTRGEVPPEPRTTEDAEVEA